MSKEDSFDFTEEQLAEMSDVERAAVQSKEEDAAANDSDTEGAGEQAAADGESKEQVKPDPVVDDVKVIETAAEAKSEAKQEPAPQPTFDDRLTAIDTELARLGAAMEDGEIGFAEYSKQFSALTKQQTRLEIEIEQQAVAQQTAANSWQDAQARFFDNEDHAGIKESPMLYNALSYAVTEVSNSKEAEGKDFDWILNKAKESVESGLGVKFGKKDAPVADVKQTKKALDSVELPKTLGNIPAAKAHDDSEFAGLNRLSTQELEAAIAKMTPEIQERYMRA